jgi:nucleoside-diphosphate-sugar epimerase
LSERLNVFVTGGSGFLGASLLDYLSFSDLFKVTTTTRTPISRVDVSVFNFGSITSDLDWSIGLNGQNCVIHTAARAHILKDQVADPLEEYRCVNVYGTLNLARQSAAAGVKRFIFISSVGVHGNITTRPLSEDDVTCPTELFAQSKLEAEQGLWDIHNETGMELVIIRPPLVYGPKAPGNFGGLMRWVRSGVPLPLGAINNQRSLVALDNLVDLIITCINHPAAANQVFFAGDGQDVSTTELVSGVAQAMGNPSRLIPVPSSLLMLGATLIGKKAMAQRLLGSFQVDISKARNLLGWEPPITVDEGLRRCFQSKDKY